MNKSKIPLCWKEGGKIHLNIQGVEHTFEEKDCLTSSQQKLRICDIFDMPNRTPEHISAFLDIVLELDGA